MSARPSAASVAVTVAFWLVAGLSMPVLFVVAAVVFLGTAAFDPDRRVLHAVVCRMCHGYLRLNPLWHVRVEGRERIPRGGAVLIANHQSLADVPTCMGLHRPFKFVSKASLFALPLVGWAMWMLRYVRLERGRPHSTRAMLDECRGWLRRGVPVLMFPEGTYATGAALLHFKPGAFLLARDERVPMVPVLLSGTRELVVGDGPWMAPRVDIRVRVLDPVEFPPGEDPVRVAAEMRARFERELGRHLPGAGV
ncbi:MAG TPA: lysophospholipid acyltransferase family protein [Myxococcaceae bacterium]|nr:lysophospholipid acyltransferase family protein [Myxococcaceae bacterium]